MSVKLGNSREEGGATESGQSLLPDLCSLCKGGQHGSPGLHVHWGFAEVWIRAYAYSFNRYLLSTHTLCWKYSSEQKQFKKGGGEGAAFMGVARKDFL